MRRRRTGATAFEGDHRRAFPQVNPVWWAWLDLNQRPHPYQLSRAQPCADRRFPRSVVSVRGEGDAFVATLVQAVQARQTVLRPSSDDMKSSRWWMRHPHASIKTRRHRRPSVTRRPRRTDSAAGASIAPLS